MYHTLLGNNKDSRKVQSGHWYGVYRNIKWVMVTFDIGPWTKPNILCPPH